MLATEKRIMIPADVPHRPEIEQTLQADGWQACAYSDVRDFENILSSGMPDAVVLHCPVNTPVDIDLVKVVRNRCPGTFLIGMGAEGLEFDTSLRRESSPYELAVALKMGAAMREVREAERRMRERLKSLEEQNQAQVERIKDLESQCTTLERWAQTAQELAVHDELTGLYNRRHFVQAADAELERSRRTGTVFALAMIDIDHFKHYNDTYGHPTGDLILKQFARVLVRSLRKMDTVARYGGEEFVLLLPETAGVKDGFDPVRLIERLRMEIEKDGLLNGRNRIKAPITISAGVVKYPDDGQAIADLIREADVRLLRAKATGRNRVCWSRE